MSVRSSVKRGLGSISGRAPASGVTILIYHRIGGGSGDERDVPLSAFENQMDVLRDHAIVGLDDALDGLDRGDRRHRVVLTFDDGFSDVYERAWPILADRAIPFTIFIATDYIGREMTWSGSTAREPGRGATASQLQELASSTLCTIGNHTHSHALPDHLSESEIDRCTETIEGLLGVTPRHFAFPWGVPVPRLDEAIRKRFRSAATGQVGRNLPGCDYMSLRRVPVRATDPPRFFRAKLQGRLLPERTYALLTSTVKHVKSLGRTS